MNLIETNLKESAYKVVSAVAVSVAGLMFLLTLLTYTWAKEEIAAMKQSKDSIVIDSYYKLEVLQKHKERIEQLELDINWLKGLNGKQNLVLISDTLNL